MNTTTTINLARVLADHVLPTMDNHDIQPLSLSIRRPGIPERAILRDCLDAHGDTPGPVAVPDAVLTVHLAARDWALLFCPVQPRARQEGRCLVDLCDPAAAEYCLEHPSRIGDRWTVARIEHTAGEVSASEFRAMDGAHPGVIWVCSSSECGSYAGLQDRLIAWETGEDRHHGGQ